VGNRPAQARVVDAYNRPLESLRLAVTAECNYRCVFCHIEGEPIGGPARLGSLPPRITPEEYGIIAEAAWLLGVKSFKITGGEPTTRQDLPEIVSNIRKHAPGAEISMTTNGYLLPRQAPRLARAGLERVNISVHSLDPEKYEFITGVPGLDKALESLEAAVNAGLRVKINMTIMKGVNDGEILDLARLAKKYGAVLQVIELQPVGLGARFFKQYYYPARKVEEYLLSLGASVRRRKLHNRPIYILPTGEKIEVVQSYDNPLFCLGCTRIRIGPFGDVSPCLNWKGPRPSILTPIREAASRRDKVLAAVRVLLEANSLRRPTFFPRIGRELADGAGRGLRVWRHPKRADAERLLRELERRLQ